MGRRPETRRAAVGGCGTCYPVFSVLGCQASPYRGADWRFITGVHEAERQGRTTLYSPESRVPSRGRRAGTWLMTCRRTTQCRGPVDGTEPVARNWFILDLASGPNFKSSQVVMLAGNPRRHQIKAAEQPSSRLPRSKKTALGQGDKASTENNTEAPRSQL